MLGLFEFGNLTYDKEKLIDFLIQHGVLASTIKCGNCNNHLNINKNTLTYKCRKRCFVKNAHKKRVSKQCGFHKSARIGTLFSQSHLNIAVICRIVACFLLLKYPRQKDTQDETGVTSSTIVEWFSFCREVCVFWAEKRSKQLGGPGHTVEIIEAQIGQRKYNHDQFVEGNWVFGGYERDSKQTFIVPVKDRTETTLLECIREWVLPGTTIVSECWKSYNCLSNESFQHLIVNHSYNFVDSKPGAHIKIKHVWREVLGNIPSFVNRSRDFLGYLSEFFFKRTYSRLERIEIFFDIIAEMYPPISNLRDHPELSQQESGTR